MISLKVLKVDTFSLSNGLFCKLNLEAIKSVVSINVLKIGLMINSRRTCLNSSVIYPLMLSTARFLSG